MRAEGSRLVCGAWEDVRSLPCLERVDELTFDLDVITSNASRVGPYVRAGMREACKFAIVEHQGGAGCYSNARKVPDWRLRLRPCSGLRTSYCAHECVHWASMALPMNTRACALDRRCAVQWLMMGRRDLGRGDRSARAPTTETRTSLRARIRIAIKLAIKTVLPFSGIVP